MKNLSTTDGSLVQAVLQDSQLEANVRCVQNNDDHLALVVWPVIRHKLSKMLDPGDLVAWEKYTAFDGSTFYVQPTEYSKKLIKHAIQALRQKYGVTSQKVAT